MGFCLGVRVLGGLIRIFSEDKLRLPFLLEMKCEGRGFFGQVQLAEMDFEVWCVVHLVLVLM